MSSALGMVLAASILETLLGDQPSSLAALAPVILRRSRRSLSSWPSLSLRTVGLPCVDGTVDSPCREWRCSRKGPFRARGLGPFAQSYTATCTSTPIWYCQKAFTERRCKASKPSTGEGAQGSPCKLHRNQKDTLRRKRNLSCRKPCRTSVSGGRSRPGGAFQG